MEVANAAVTNEADAYLEAHNVPVVPDVVVNAGGITVSHFEWAQNRSGQLIAEEEVREQLQSRMSATTLKLISAADEFRVSLATAAQILAIQKLRLAYGV